MVVFVGDWRIMIEMEVDVGYVDFRVWRIGDEPKEDDNNGTTITKRGGWKRAGGDGIHEAVAIISCFL